MSHIKKKVAKIKAGGWFSGLEGKGKNVVFDHIISVLQNQGLVANQEDRGRPWGGFLQFSPGQFKRFWQIFFGKSRTVMPESQRALAKIIIIAPKSRFSWQYHLKRDELMRVVRGPLTLKISLGDKEPEKGREMKEGEEMKITGGMRHRVEAGEKWGIYAEVWLSQDLQNPSSEKDIVRIRDDYGRKKSLGL